MDHNVLAIVIASLKGDVPDDGTLEERLLATMIAGRKCWITNDSDEQFRASIGAVMSVYGEGSEEYKRMESELGTLARISAFMNAAQLGVQADISSVWSQTDDEIEVVGLMKLWEQSATPDVLA